MSDDAISAIRKALEAGSTPGPWHSDRDGAHGVTIKTDTGRIVCWVSGAVSNSSTLADGDLISACNPSAIRALLAELDAARKALRELVDAEAACCTPETCTIEAAQRRNVAWVNARSALAKSAEPQGFLGKIQAHAATISSAASLAQQNAAAQEPQTCESVPQPVVKQSSPVAPVAAAPSTQQDERAAFEAWARPNWFIERHRLNPDSYSDSGTECAWRGWQARAALKDRT